MKPLHITYMVNKKLIEVRKMVMFEVEFIPWDDLLEFAHIMNCVFERKVKNCWETSLQENICVSILSKLISDKIRVQELT